MFILSVLDLSLRLLIDFSLQLPLHTAKFSREALRFQELFTCRISRLLSLISFRQFFSCRYFHRHDTLQYLIPLLSVPCQKKNLFFHIDLKNRMCYNDSCQSIAL